MKLLYFQTRTKHKMICFLAVLLVEKKEALKKCLSNNERHGEVIEMVRKSKYIFRTYKYCSCKKDKGKCFKTNSEMVEISKTFGTKVGHLF